jgi:hypothetical protein
MNLYIITVDIAEQRFSGVEIFIEKLEIYKLPATDHIPAEQGVE